METMLESRTYEWTGQELTLEELEAEEVLALPAREEMTDLTLKANLCLVIKLRLGGSDGGS